MLKKISVFILVLLIAGAGWFIFNRSRQADMKVAPEVHYHAGFKVYENDHLVDFSKPEYMHFAPCGSDEDKKKMPETASDRAHLHNNIGDVVHVHSNKATWGDLWEDLRFHPQGKVTYYLNGKKAEDLGGSVIQPYDRLLLLVGDNTNIEQKYQTVPDAEKIKQAVASTEGC